jgi:hypothetical protein
MKDQVIRYVTCKGAKEGVILDKEDAIRIDQHTWTGSDNGNGITYVHRKTKKGEGGKPRKIYLHRVLAGAVEGEYVDHINRNPLDNRKSNLRIASRTINNINRGKNKTWKGRPTSSVYKGVSWNQKMKMWQAYICCNSKRKHLGYFTEERGAALAYDIRAYELHGEYAYQNFPRLDMAA